VTEGVLPVFHRKTGFSEYLHSKYSDSPRPAGTPLINAGGKSAAFFNSCGPCGFQILPYRSVMERIFSASSAVAKPGLARQVQLAEVRVPGWFIRPSAPIWR